MSSTYTSTIRGGTISAFSEEFLAKLKRLKSFIFLTLGGLVGITGYLAFSKALPLEFLLALGGCLGGSMILVYRYLVLLDERYLCAEYEKNLFEKSASLNSEFAFILRADGTIITVDSGFTRYFPASLLEQTFTVETMIHTGAISRSGKDKIYKALRDLQKVSVPFDTPALLSHLIHKHKEHHFAEDLPLKSKLTLTLEPMNLEGQDLFFGHAFQTDKAALNEFVETVLPAMYDQSTLGMITIKQDHSSVYVNTTCAKMLGYSRKELLKSSDIELGLLLNESNNVLLKHKEGQFLPFCSYLVQKIPYQNDLLSTFILIPKPEPLQSEVSEFEQKLWEVLETSPIPHMLMDQEGKVLSTNGLCRKIVLKEQIHWQFADILNAEQSRIFKESLAQLASTNQASCSIELQLRDNPACSVILYLNRIQSLHQADPYHILGYIIDISEQKNWEMKFIHAQKIQAVGQLASGIAHDFNNLLTAIIGFCDLMLTRHPPGDPSFSEIIQIKQNGNRAANLVRQLLAFSRKQTIQPRLIEVAGVVAEIGNVLGRLIGGNIVFRVEYGHDLGLIKVDPSQLEQVIMNLVVNARDAIGDEVGVITLRAYKTDIATGFEVPSIAVGTTEETMTPGKYLCLEVSDTGQGIPPENMKKIFEPFFSTKAIGAGTGLGLATVYGIVKQTGGHIYVKSSVGQGTTFYIYIKSHIAEPIKLLEEGETMLKEPEIFMDITGRETVLLVEDEAPVRMFSGQALTKKGYKVIEADCGESALSIIREKGEQIDIIVTDVMMPGMSGPAMVEEIMRQYPKIKVLFVSGYGEDFFVSTYGEDRDFNFLPKPFTLKQLAERIRRILEETKSQEEIARAEEMIVS